MENNFMYGDLTEAANTVTITKERYEELIETESWLLALESAGVDNWDGIDFARELYEEDNE